VMTAIRRGQIDWYRRSEPGIPRVAPGGVPNRDEIELERVIT